MTRFLVAAMAILGPATATAQPAGSVLTASDVWSEHPFQRPVDVDGRTWLALIVADGGSRLEPVQVRWTASLLFEDSVFELDVTPERSPNAMPHLLMSDIPGVQPGPATTVVADEVSLWGEERRLEMRLGATAYAVALSASDPALCDATVVLTQGALAQTLYPPGNDDFSCDAPHFSIQWAGDLDGDGRLDLVTTFSPKYSWYPRRLYLSSAAQPGALVGLVAVLGIAAA
jgi:hypothetical protein